MSREKWGSSQSWGTHIVVVPVGRVAAGRKMGRLRRRLKVAVGMRRRHRREGRHAVGGRRPRQLLLEGHRLRLRLDLEGCDVAPDRDDSALHLNMKYKLSLVLRRAAARARKETVYHYTTEPQTCVLAS